jgi:hypothetical protein
LIEGESEIDRRTSAKEDRKEKEGKKRREEKAAMKLT